MPCNRLIAGFGTKLSRKAIGRSRVGWSACFFLCIVFQRGPELSRCQLVQSPKASREFRVAQATLAIKPAKKFDCVQIKNLARISTSKYSFCVGGSTLCSGGGGERA